VELAQIVFGGFGRDTTQHKAVSVVELRDLDSNVNESVDVWF
jgi:hypothetical protein